MDDPQGETITITLPRLEDFAEDYARISRMMDAADLAGELTPEAFAKWMQYGDGLERRKA